MQRTQPILKRAGDALRPANGRGDCDHSGLHSPLGIYLRGASEIRYVTVCDHCGAETAEICRESYTPAFDPFGNDAYLQRSA